MRSPTTRPPAAATVLSVFVAAASLGGLAKPASAVDSAKPADPRSHEVLESMLPRLCFDPSVSREDMDRARLESLAAIEAGDTDLPSALEVQSFNAGSSWGNGDGSPIEITWSLVPDGTKISDRTASLSLTSDMFVRMDAQFADRGGRQAWIGEIEKAFGRWGEMSGITFRRVGMSNQPWDDGAPQSFSKSDGSSTRGQIRIGMAPIDGSGGFVGWNFLPSGGGDMTLDSTENWFRWPDLLTLRNSLTHELGHGLGLDHVCSSTDGFLMEPQIMSAFDGPQHDDIRGVQRLYGDAAEPNDSGGLAVSIGSISSGGFLAFGPAVPPAIESGSVLGLRDSADEDWFAVSIGAADSLSITVRPLGFVYDDGNQSSSGSCGDGPDIDSASAVDLRLELHSGGSRPELIASADSAGPGLAESIGNLSIPSAGEYLIRVSAGRDGGSSTQLYALELAAPAAALCDADITTTGSTLETSEGFLSPDGAVDLDDLAVFVDCWLVRDAGVCDLTTTGATIPGMGGAGEPDGMVDGDDLGYYMQIWFSACN